VFAGRMAVDAQGYSVRTCPESWRGEVNPHAWIPFPNCSCSPKINCTT
jgi:hypothetical protein